jgi:hypothetical protein
VSAGEERVDKRLDAPFFQRDDRSALARSDVQRPSALSTLLF